MSVKEIKTKPIEGQKPGTSGLRKRYDRKFIYVTAHHHLELRFFKEKYDDTRLILIIASLMNSITRKTSSKQFLTASNLRDLPSSLAETVDITPPKSSRSSSKSHQRTEFLNLSSDKMPYCPLLRLLTLLESTKRMVAFFSRLRTILEDRMLILGSNTMSLMAALLPRVSLTKYSQSRRRSIGILSWRLRRYVVGDSLRDLPV